MEKGSKEADGVLRKEVESMEGFKREDVFMKNNIPKNKILMSGKLKKFITFDTRRIA